MSGALRRIRINHEETKSTKKHRKKLRALRFFVVDSLGKMAIPFRPLLIRYGIKVEPLVLSVKFITKSYVI
jgi:hypothetical protein